MSKSREGGRAGIADVSGRKSDSRSSWGSPAEPSRLVGAAAGGEPVGPRAGRNPAAPWSPIGLFSAHIDCDIRSAIRCAYDSARPHMVCGGCWVLDDPLAFHWLGAAETMEDLLVRRDGLNCEQAFPRFVFRQP